MHNNFRSMQQIAWTGYVTIVRTEVRRFEDQAQTFVPPVITMVLSWYFWFYYWPGVGHTGHAVHQFIGPGSSRWH